jgi:hypothetical protein
MQNGNVMTRLSTLTLAVCITAASAVAASPALAAPAGDDVAITLNGSRASMLRQNRIAKQELYSFLRTPTQVLRFVDDGYLVHLTGNADYAVIAGYPYARPVVRSFIERLSADYRSACGERLVVTSLTRPSTRQPRNASPLSVHPAGMAVDLRVSARAACRDWLSQELLTLEERGVLDATREYNPPHFHVAVFPSPFQRYDQTLSAIADAEEAMRRLEAAVSERLAQEAAADAAAEQAGSDALGDAVDAGQATLLAVPRATLVIRVAALLARLVLPLPV